jgi:cbb3-type cytochrome oxidase subunit 3
MIALIIMLLGSVGCWYFVFSRRTRREHSRALRDFYRLSKDQENMFEASGFAAMLLAAILFTIFFLALLVMEIVSRQ